MVLMRMMQEAESTLSSATTFDAAGIEAGTPGVYAFDATSDASAVVKQISEGLLTFKFLDRYPLDSQ
ncbi:hypothetical protein CFE70_000766 [Pyrenophora teres f. teres 0-1]